MSETFSAIQTRLLVERADRLASLIRNGPKKNCSFGYVIGTEISLLTVAAAGVFGESTFVSLYAMMVRAERIRLGFCGFCKGEPAPVTREQAGVCDECAAKAEAFGETEQKDYPDSDGGL